MSRDLRGASQCEAVRDELPELALGILSGRRRSEVLDHVDICTRCCAELQQLSTVADGLFQLAPQIEPPVGFELRLAARLQGAEAHRPKRGWRVGALCAAGTVMVVLGFGAGAFLAPRSASQARTARAALISADLMSRGRVLGQVVVTAGPPAWMFVTVNGAVSSGSVRCDVTLAGGQVETIGVFQTSGNYGAWSEPLVWAARDVRSAQLIDSDGSIVANAQLGT